MPRWRLHICHDCCAYHIFQCVLCKYTHFSNIITKRVSVLQFRLTFGNRQRRTCPKNRLLENADKLIAPLFCTTNEKSAQNNFIKSIDMNSSALMPPSPTMNDDVGPKSPRNLSKPSVRFSALPLTSIATNEFFLRSMKSTSS